MQSAKQVVLGAYDAGNSDTPDLSEHSDTFSRANVFALFLTLSFCLIVQPPGSLIYAKPQGIIGRLLFFFWRLNPLACAVEVVFLVVAFADGVWIAFKSRRTDPAESKIGFWKELQSTVLAVQILRGHGRLPQHWRTMAEVDHRAPEVLPQDSPARETGSSPRQTSPRSISSSGGASALGLRDDDPTTPLLHNEVGPYSDEASPSGSLDIADHTMARANNLSPDVTSASDIEAGGSEVSNSEGTVHSDRPGFPGLQLVRHLPRHAELIIDIISTVAVVLQIVKLGSIVIPLHIRIPAWFMVAGWAAIQTLLLVSHRRYFDMEEPEYVIRRALELEERLHGPVLWSVLTVVLIPVFGYLTVVMFFKTEPLPIIMKEVYSFFNMSFLLVANQPLWEGLSKVLWPSCLGRRSKTCAERLKCVSETSISPIEIIIAFILAAMVLCGAGIGLCWGYSIAMCMLYGVRVSWYYMVLPFAVSAPVMWAWLFWPGVPFAGSWKGSEWVRSVCLLFSLVTTAFFFAGAMIMYDPSQTYKPEWLDWLGKL